MKHTRLFSMASPLKCNESLKKCSTKIVFRVLCTNSMRNNQLKIVSLYETVLGSKGTVATVYASQPDNGNTTDSMCLVAVNTN